MTSRKIESIELIPGSLDMIVLWALASMGPLHAYALTARLEQLAEPKLTLKQGTLYPALIRLEQKGCIKGTWQTTESGREAKYYAITRAGHRALKEHVERWRLFSGLVERLLTGEG
jgi:PadR family transcriptional regulator PadR